MCRKLLMAVFILAVAVVTFVSHHLYSFMAVPAETGGWYYHDSSGSRLGDVHVDSSYEDLKGNVWSSL